MKKKFTENENKISKLKGTKMKEVKKWSKIEGKDFESRLERGNGCGMMCVTSNSSLCHNCSLNRYPTEAKTLLWIVAGIWKNKWKKSLTQDVFRKWKWIYHLAHVNLTLFNLFSKSAGIRKANCAETHRCSLCLCSCKCQHSIPSTSHLQSPSNSSTWSEGQERRKSKEKQYKIFKILSMSSNKVQHVDTELSVLAVRTFESGMV